MALRYKLWIEYVQKWELRNSLPPPMRGVFHSQTQNAPLEKEEVMLFCGPVKQEGLSLV